MANEIKDDINISINLSIQKVLNNVNKLQGKLSDLQSQMIKFNNEVKGSTTNLSFKSPLNNMAKSTTDVVVGTRALIRAVMRLGHTLGDWISTSIAYTENINLLGVAMGEAASEAEEFVLSMSKAFGLDPNNLVRYLGVFQELTTSLGIARKDAYILSKNYTKLGLDISSLFNIDIDVAYQKLQSGISGITRPLKAIGIDVTQSALENTARIEAQKAYAAGNIKLGDQLSKNSSQWTQAERQQLIYLTILRQTIDSQGDLARTLDQPAQQVRILTNQISILKRTVGDLVVPLLTRILPAITAFIMTLNDGLTGLVEIMRTLFNFKPLTAKESSELVKNDKENIEDMGEAAEKTEKQMKGLINGLDKFNVLSKSNNKDLGNQGFDFGEMPEYNLDFDKIQSSAKQIYESMKGLAPIITGVTIALTGLAAATLWNKLSLLATSVFGAIKTQSLSLNAALTTGLIFGTLSLIKNWDKLSTTGKVLSTVLIALGGAYELVVVYKKVNVYLDKIIERNLGEQTLALERQRMTLKKVATSWQFWTIAVSSAVTAGYTFYKIYESWGDMTTGQRTISIISGIATAFFGLASALAAVKQNYVGAALFGAAAVGSQIIGNTQIPKKYAQGGLPSKGDLFIANEAGPELVGSMGGKSNVVANNDMITAAIENAAYRGVSSALSEFGGGSNTNVEISLDDRSLNANSLARVIAPALRAKIKNTGGVL